MSVAGTLAVAASGWRWVVELALAEAAWTQRELDAVFETVAGVEGYERSDAGHGVAGPAVVEMEATDAAGLANMAVEPESSDAGVDIHADSAE